MGKGDQLLPVAIHKGAAEDRAFGWDEVSGIQEEALVSGARAPGEGSTHLGCRTENLRRRLREAGAGAEWKIEGVQGTLDLLQPLAQG